MFLADNMKRNYEIKLDMINSLRGLAIIAVFATHTIAYQYKIGSSFIGDLSRVGWFGVEIFFMLSGFVLYLPFANGEIFNTKDFYIRRLRRLYPLFLLCSSVCMIFYSNLSPCSYEFWKQIARNISFTYYFTNIHRVMILYGV